MIVELNAKQRDLLLRLLDNEIGDLGPVIHHTHTYKDAVKEQREDLRVLRELLTDVPVETVPQGSR